MADYDDLNTNRIFTFGILSIVVTAVTALAVQVVYYSLVQWHEADLAEKSSYRRQNKVLADQTETISKYGVNPDTGSVTIPISKAMQLIAADNSEGDSHADDDHGKDADHGKEHAEDHDTKDHDGDKDHNEKEHKEKDGDKKHTDEDA